MGLKRLSSAAIYDAATDDDQFRALPVLLAETYGARSSLLAWHHGNGATVLADSGYWSPQFLETYATCWASKDPCLNATSDPRFQNVALDLERLVPVDEYERSVFYNEFIREAGDDTVRAIGIRTGNRQGTGMIALHRGRTQQAFSERDVAALQKQSEHLRQMLTIRARLVAHTQHSATLETILNSMRDAAILVGPERKISYANQPAEAVLNAHKVLQVKRGQLHTTAPSCDQRLIDAIQTACHASEPEGGAVLLENLAGAITVVMVAPFRSPNGQPLALILVPQRTSDRHASQALPEQLRRLLGLTASEAEIALQIAGGLTSLEIAELREVSPETVRSQVKCLMAKLGCRRQAEVVALIGTIPLSTM